MDIEEALRIAKLWREGKMIGSDEDDVRDALLGEVERLQRELEEARKVWPTPEMIEAGAEYLYGHPKEKAIEWAKRDKFESCECQAEEVFRAMIAAREKQG